MSDCCSADNNIGNTPKKKKCFDCGQQCNKVSHKTILYHVKTPWRIKISEQANYFCDNPECDVVYFALDDTKIYKDQLRTKVGIKESDSSALLCYCFGVSKSDADAISKAFVVEQTKNASCSCITYNPSGKCCLKDFP